MIVHIASRRCEGWHPSPATSTGPVASVVLPIPSCPLSFLPQHLTPPPLTIAQVWSYPRAMATAETPGERIVVDIKSTIIYMLIVYIQLSVDQSIYRHILLTTVLSTNKFLWRKGGGAFMSLTYILYYIYIIIIKCFLSYVGNVSM